MDGIVSGLENFSGVYAIITGIITSVSSATVFIYQHIKHKNERYKQYASDLYREDNETAQITSAILLRSYLGTRKVWSDNSYSKNTLNLIAAILRHSPNGNLQKTLADSISYVHKADGQDFQYANMHMCSIKPQSRMRYDITGNAKLLQKYISLRGADFYRADISLSGLYNINAEKGVFFECALRNTTFHNSILKEADFRSADVCNLKFKDCDLQGAKFDGALQLEKAKIYDKKKGIDGIPLIDFLDEEGVFIGLQSNRKYNVNNIPQKIFISKLGAMNTKQLAYYEELKRYLSETYKYKFEFIDPKDYCDSGQIEMITNHMSQCSGILILAFSYMHIDNGNMTGAQNVISNEEHISPWLHIEATISNVVYKLPCMVITEEKVFRNGIFDQRVIQNEELMYFISNYNGILTNKDKEQLDSWSKKVYKYSTQKL